jgi:hypothetical protein
MAILELMEMMLILNKMQHLARWSVHHCCNVNNG